jgi:hypothetical protein
MAKYESKGGVVVEAYVVTQQEGKLGVQLDGGGMETLRAGDALINGPDGSASFIVRAPLFAALFDQQEKQPEQQQPEQEPEAEAEHALP